MSNGITGSSLVSWLRFDDESGAEYYITTETDEIINVLGEYKKVFPNATAASANSLTIEAPSGGLRIFPLINKNDAPNFGIFIGSGKEYIFERVQFESILVKGNVGQAIRWYVDRI